MLLQISGVGKISKKRFGAEIHSHELKKKKIINKINKNIYLKKNQSYKYTMTQIRTYVNIVTSIIQWFHKMEYLWYMNLIIEVI